MDQSKPREKRPSTVQEGHTEVKWNFNNENEGGGIVFTFLGEIHIPSQMSLEVVQSVLKMKGAMDIDPELVYLNFILAGLPLKATEQLIRLLQESQGE